MLYFNDGRLVYMKTATHDFVVNVFASLFYVGSSEGKCYHFGFPVGAQEVLIDPGILSINVSCQQNAFGGMWTVFFFNSSYVLLLGFVCFLKQISNFGSVSKLSPQNQWYIVDPVILNLDIGGLVHSENEPPMVIIKLADSEIFFTWIFFLYW